MRDRAWLCAVLLACAAGALAQGERPCVTIGRAARAPVIDGRLAPGEWDGAATVGGFVEAGGGALAAPATTVSLCYDARCLYFALVCQEPERDRPRGYRRSHDDHVYEDDCVQVLIAPEDLDRAGRARINVGGYAGAYNNWYSDIKAYYEFTVNGQGSTSEARNDVRDWAAPWQARVSRTKDAWIAELAVPFTSLGLPAAPAEGLFGLNLFRLRQPDASGWLFTGFGGYTPLPLGAVVLAPGSPLVRQSLAAPAGGELVFGLLNPGGDAVEVNGRVGDRPAVTVTVPAHGSAPLSLPYDPAAQAGSRAAYSVQAVGREAPLLSGVVPLPRPQPHALSLRYYALPGLLEGTVHCGAGPTPARALLVVDGRPAAEESLAGKQGCRLQATFGSAPPGEKHTAQVRLVEAGGSTIGERSVSFTTAARPAWSGTRAGLPADGNSPGVLPPWTPLHVAGKTVQLLGKQLTYTDLALPAQVQSAGAQLLAAPLRVVITANGRPVQWQSRSCEFTGDSQEQVRVESLWRSTLCDLRLSSTVEYDGFTFNELRVVPHGRVRLERLALEVPLRPERARYFYGGHAQACGALSPHGLNRPLTPNLWIGDESRGVAWLAESLDWVQAQDRGRQVQVVPGARATVWRSTFVDTPTVLKEPYAAQFILQYTPAKPVSLAKSGVFHGAYYGMESAHGGGTVRLPTAGNLSFERGTLECFVKPQFDPAEAYDPALDRSQYNRQLLFLFADPGGGAEILILYYNADDRSLRLVKKDAAGGYPLVLGTPARLRPGAWNYVALSWGDRLRLCVNGEVVEREVKGTVSGDPARGLLQWTLGQFALDEVRISKVQRPLDTVPAGELTADADTLFLDHCERPGGPQRLAPGSRARFADSECGAVEGLFGKGLLSRPETIVEKLAREGKRIVIFHESWSRYQGYPDLEQTARLKAIADACHRNGLRFLIYFCQLMSDAAPEWPALSNDFLALPERMWYHRDDVKQDCYVSCVNGPYGDLLLDGIAKLADETGIDGVYMDGTTVPWDCANPTHAGCAHYLGDGTYSARCPIRETRQFMKRLRSIFVQRGKQVFLDAHTGGCINIATQSFCDGYYDGETLARYKPGFRLAPEAFLAGYMGKQFGFRGEFLPNRHTMDEALAISLVHDTATRGQPSEVDRAWAPYEDAQTTYLPYWERSRLYRVEPAQVLGSAYLKPDRALLVLGSQTEAPVTCRVTLTGLLGRLPQGAAAFDALSGEPVGLSGGVLELPLPGRSWRMIELRK